MKKFVLAVAASLMVLLGSAASIAPNGTSTAQASERVSVSQHSDIFKGDPRLYECPTASYNINTPIRPI